MHQYLPTKAVLNVLNIDISPFRRRSQFRKAMLEVLATSADIAWLTIKILTDGSEKEYTDLWENITYREVVFDIRMRYFLFEEVVLVQK